MRIVIQRVKHASVTIDGNIKSAIQKGLLILLGIGEDDDENDVKWLVNKVIGLRIFDDEQGVMNKSVMDIGGEALVVSQFTLMASYKKGNRSIVLLSYLHQTPLRPHFFSLHGLILGRKTCRVVLRFRVWQRECSLDDFPFYSLP